MIASDRWIARLTAAAAGMTAPHLSILIFHRVLPRPDPLFPGEPDADRFDRLMGIVARGFHVLPLGRALALQAQGRLPARALVITFDDGYADNAEIALPILQRHGLTATFFVATGFLDGGRMFNDTVIECLRRSPLESVDLDDFGLGRMGLRSAAERRAVIDALLPKVKYLPLPDREPQLRRLAQLARTPDLPSDLMMRSEQVRELHRAGMEIGGHTVNHPILTKLDDAEAEAEIARGRDRLQQIVDAPIDLFAYPNGRPMQDYDARHVAIVRRLGFRAAVSTAAGVAAPDADRFQLPRYTPWERRPVQWAARLVQKRLTGRTHQRAGVPD